MLGFGKKKTPEKAKSAPVAAPAGDPVDAKKALTEADKNLLRAALIGNAEEIKTQLKAGADPNVQWGDTPKQSDRAGYTALMYACESGPDALEGVKALLEAGALVNYRTPHSKRTALTCAANGCSAPYDRNYAKDAEPLIDLLVAAGADVNDLLTAISALGAAINLQHDMISASAVKALLKHKADPNTDPVFSSILRIMCAVTARKSGEQHAICMEAIKAMVEGGAHINVNVKSESDRFPVSLLGLATGYNDYELTEYLLSRGADPNEMVASDMSLLEEKRKHLAKRLEEGEPIDNTLAVIEALETAIMRTPDARHQDGQKQDISTKRQGNTLVSIAKSIFSPKKNFEAIVPPTIRAKKQDFSNDYILTETDKRLLRSAEKGDVEDIKMCLLYGANPNICSPDQNANSDYAGYTPLMYACTKGPDALEGVQALLTAGADVHSKTHSKTALLCAVDASCTVSNNNCFKDAEPLIDALMAAGADIKDSTYQGVLGYAMNMQEKVISASAVKALLKHGADPNNDRGYDSLVRYMCEVTSRSFGERREECMEAVRAMVEAGATLNPQDKIHALTDTPLGVAAIHGAWELTQYLLSQGADINVVDENGVGLVEKVRQVMANKLKNGEPIEDTLAIIHTLEAAIMVMPDGKGQNGSAPQHINQRLTNTLAI